MGFNNLSSDYGSGSSMNSSTSWGSHDLEWQSFQSHLLGSKPHPKAASFADLVTGRCTLEDVMQEFRMNGSDAPYNPDDDQLRRQSTGVRTPLAAPAAYMRQRSWPAPERSPAQRLPRPNTVCITDHARTSNNDALIPEASTAATFSELSEEQRRVLSSLPDAAVLTLLREIQRRSKRQPEVCRFCKNNGERESYYRSHTLRDAHGRVICPVLRAFICKRCGARGDNAHTIKYCPLSTTEERIKSAAMMRSVRMASGRRRSNSITPSNGALENFVVFGETPISVIQDTSAFNIYEERAPLDPLWAALEQKLLL